MKRLLTLLVVCLLVTLSAWGRSQQSGLCSKGGQTVTMSGLGSSTGKFVQTYPACTITVYLTGTSTLATLYSDSGGTPKANPFTSDSTTSYWSFYADNGTYDVQASGTGVSVPFVIGTYSLFDISGATISGATITNPTITGGTMDNTVIGGTTPAAGSFTTLVATSLNNVQYAGTGATPTIDTAVTACGVNPCVVVVPGTYSGAESASLTTLSDGYKVYAGANNVTILDLRANAATPATPADAPLYPFLYGGRLAGQLTRIGANYWSSSPADSTSAIAGANWLQGTLPSNNGSIIGLVGFTEGHDTVTIGASTSIPVGVDGEAYWNPTTVDTALPYLAGGTFQAGITRTNAVGAVTTAVGLVAQPCTNASTSGATITNCYAIEAAAPSVGTSRNYSMHAYGNWLTERGTEWDTIDSGSTVRMMTKWDASDLVIHQPMSNTQGWSWQDQSASHLFDLKSTGATLNVPLTLTTAGSASLINTVASTQAKFSELANTGNAGFYYGVESSTSGGFFTGSSAYESVLYSTGNNLFINAPLVRTQSGLKIGASGSTISDSRDLVQAVYNHSGTVQLSPHIVQDSCTLGTDCAVTLTGSAVYTSSTSYTCSCVDNTAAAACKVAQASGSAFTITGTGTDSIRYVCVGN